MKYNEWVELAGSCSNVNTARHNYALLSLTFFPMCYVTGTHQKRFASTLRRLQIPSPPRKAPNDPTGPPCFTSQIILVPGAVERTRNFTFPAHSQVSFSEHNMTATMKPEHLKHCDMTILSKESRSIGLQPKPNQGPAQLGGINDRLHHIRDDLESQHEQLQEKTIGSARKQLIIAKELNEKIKVLYLLTSRKDDGRLYNPNSCRIRIEYQIRIELQHDADQIAVRNRIATIKKQAEELLTGEMVKGAK
jgi:hypothetical protein